MDFWNIARGNVHWTEMLREDTQRTEEIPVMQPLPEDVRWRLRVELDRIRGLVDEWARELEAGA